MRAVPILVAVLLVMPMATQAQVRPEIRPFAGAFIPTGDQRNVLDDAVLSGAEVALEAADMLHLVGTFAFTGPNFDKQIANGGHMHIFQYDIGGELFKNVDLKNAKKLRPFFGVGLGIRTYDPTSSNLGSKSYPAGYGTIGSEFQMNRIAIRLEARDYVTRFKGISGNDEASTRNDVLLSAGLAYHLR